MQKVTATIGQQNYKTEIKNATHTLIADEPIEVGGQDLGFAPRELLASSLAACTSITLKMYAERKGWDLKEAIVEVTFEWSKEESKSIISRRIELKGTLNAMQKERLLVIANSCPIHKILSNPLEIASSLS
ncbi:MULTISPECIES: OsmC family protein [unclassified Flavobacterium]|uniref:OsmC family protein n=1 Tax=unclassified Flavobacterium TaxID=196869 RepID=UPI003619D007